MRKVMPSKAENTPRLVQGAYMQLKGVMHRLRPNLSHFLSQLIPQIDRLLRKSLDQRLCQGGLWEEAWL